MPNKNSTENATPNEAALPMRVKTIVATRGIQYSISNFLNYAYRFSK